VNLALKIVEKNNFIENICMAAGGVAPVPLYLEKTCKFLKEQTISKDLLYDAIALIQEEISPITDIRGSKEYKRLLIHQLVIKSFVTLFPNRLSVEEFYEKH